MNFFYNYNASVITFIFNQFRETMLKTSAALNQTSEATNFNPEVNWVASVLLRKI